MHTKTTIVKLVIHAKYIAVKRLVTTVNSRFLTCKHATLCARYERTMDNTSSNVNAACHEQLPINLIWSISRNCKIPKEASTSKCDRSLIAVRRLVNTANSKFLKCKHATLCARDEKMMDNTSSNASAACHEELSSAGPRSSSTPKIVKSQRKLVLPSVIVPSSPSVHSRSHCELEVSQM